MQYENIHQIMTTLQAGFTERELEIVLKEHSPYEETDTLSVLTETSDELAMLTDIYALDLGENQYAVQISTMLALDLPDGPLEQLNLSSEYLNLYSPIGFYGIIRSERQFYHRFNLLVADDEPTEQVADRIVTALGSVFENIAVQYPLLTRMIAGETDCRTALEKGYFLDM